MFLCPLLLLPLSFPSSQFDSTVNKAVQDLSSVLSALNLIHTLEMQQQLQRLASEASASDATLAQELDVANQQDIQELQGHLEQLLGGQAELQQQLAAATEQQRQEWFAVTGHMVQLAGDFGVIRDEVRELANAVRAWMDERIKPQDNCSAPLVRSSLLLDRERVQWETGELDSGGFASVYPGTFDGHDVAVKLLRLCAFAGPQQREQVRWLLGDVLQRGFADTSEPGCQHSFGYTASRVRSVCLVRTPTIQI